MVVKIITNTEDTDVDDYINLVIQEAEEVHERHDAEIDELKNRVGKSEDKVDAIVGIATIALILAAIVFLDRLYEILRNIL